MSTEPLVSVVVPTYNRAYCLARTLDSVLTQTHRNLELILVDDGSSDGTQALLRDRYPNEARIRYVYQDNAGVSAARNRGLAMASGEYIALLDSDDVWKPWKLEVQVACLRRLPEAGMVWTDMEAIDPGGQVLNPKHLREMYRAYRWFGFDDLFNQHLRIEDVITPVPSELAGSLVYAGDIYSQMIMGSLVHTSTVLLRRERLAQVRSFREDLKFSGEDYDFHLRTCRAGPVAFIDVASIYYQKGMPDQLTRPEYCIHMAKNFLKTILPALAQDRDRIHLPPAMLRTLLADAYCWVAQEAIDIGDNREARIYFALSLRQDWRQPRTIGLLLAALLPPALTKGLRRIYAKIKSAVKSETEVLHS